MKRKWIAIAMSIALVAGLFGVLPAPRALAATTYYSIGSVAPNVLTSWKTNRDGTGSSPGNFTSGDTFVIQSGHNMTTSGSWPISGTGSKLWIESGGTLTATSAVTLASATTFQIDGGGTYVHSNSSAYGSTIFQGTELFNTSSTVVLNTSSTTGPSSVEFGNLTVNFTSDPGGSVNLSGAVTAINGNLTVQSTSTREFRLTGDTNFALNLGGNLNISGGVLNLASGSGAPTINIGGNFNQTGGTFTSSGSVSTVVFTGGSSSSVTFATSGGTFTNSNINWQIASGKTVALYTNFGGGSWVNSSRSMTVNGAFQINQGAWPGNGGTWSYNQTTGTLIYNNSSGSYGVGNDNYWPTTNGPVNVTVQGAGGITMNVARTVGGTFQTATGVTNGNNLTLNGTTQINSGGYFGSPPVYGATSTLVYNSGDSYNISNEWISGVTVGSGVPKNVTIQNSTAVALGNGAGSRTVVGNLTIGSGSSLSLGATIGDDLYVGGNWTNDGSFVPKNRTVTFSGTTTVLGSSITSFDYVRIAGALTGHSMSMNVAKDWTNNGTFTHNNGAVHFNGTGTQTIGGSQPTSFFDIFLETFGRTPETDDHSAAHGPALAGATVVLATQPTVEGTVTNNGTLRQTQIVNNATVDFINLKNSAGTVDKYFGVRIATTNNLGSTTVSVSGNQVCSQVNGYPVKRCFIVDPANTAASDLTFYYSQSEMQTGQTATNLKAWKYNGSSWSQAGSSTTASICAANQLNCSVAVTGVSAYGPAVDGVDASTGPFAVKESSPQAVTLADFSASQQGDAVRVTWETASELDTRGFNLYRGTSATGPDRQLNETLIPSQSQGNPGGFVYTWADRADLVPGTTYFYWVEDVDIYGAAAMHGPVSADYTVPTAVTISGIDAGPAGVGLPAAGALLALLAPLAGALTLRRRRV